VLRRQRWTNIARRYWKEAEVADRIELKLAPASETLAALIGKAAPDIRFRIHRCRQAQLRRLLRSVPDAPAWRRRDRARQHALVGRVADPQFHDADTDALRALNAKIRDDGRVDACLLP
jgi:O-methyltransferase